jgi:hypothetical protein
MQRIAKKLTSAAAAVTFLLLAVEVQAAGVAVADASPAELNEAKGPYSEGVKAMSAGRFEDAVDRFKRSYDIVASPNSRLMLGRALVKVNRLVEAYRVFEETMTQATELAATQKKYQKTAESAKRELDDLKSELAFVTVIPGTEVSLGGQRLTAAQWGRPQPVMPGRVTVEIKSADGRAREKELTLEPGLTRVLTADLAATGAYRTKPSKTAEKEAYDEAEESSTAKSAGAFSRKQVGYVAGGVGALGVVSFIGLTIMAESIFGDVASDCEGAVCSKADLTNSESKGTLRGMSYVSLVVGLAGLGTGGYLLLTDKKSSSSGTTALHLGPGSVALSRSF